MQPESYVWLDGKMLPWADATLHVSTLCVLGGINAYEVVKAYWNQEREELFVFRLDQHLRRLWRTIKGMRLPCPYTPQQLGGWMIELLQRNQVRRDAAVRVVCYLGEGALASYLPGEVASGAFIMLAPVLPSPPEGLRCCVSNWQRSSDMSAPPRLKVGANYHNARLAAVQARVDGYDEPILLNQHGEVTELPLRNLFLVRDGRLLTPALTSGLLEGVTRDTILAVAQRELGCRVDERAIGRTELYEADEAFVSSTTREVVPVLSIDRLPVGGACPGPTTLRLAETLPAIGSGQVAGYADWLTPVYGRVTAAQLVCE